MTTGAAWNIDDPLKPWARFDPDADIKIPVGVTDWLAELGTTYQSHEVLADAPLQCVSSTHSAGTITVRMKLVATPTYTAGTKYPFTVRIHGADGTTQDDRTLWLLVKPR